MIVIEEEKVRNMLSALFKFGKECEWNNAIEEAMNRFLNLPTFDIDISEYSDRLWKLAYERGQKDNVVERKKGRWIPQDHNKNNGFVTAAVYYFPRCSKCGKSGEIAFAFCPHCGAKMDGGDYET